MTSEFGNLAGRTALITGGGRGIGQAIALKLGRAGAKVLVNDFDAEPAKATVEIIRESGGDRSAVTGGTRVISDRIVVRVTSEKGRAFLDLSLIHI